MQNASLISSSNLFLTENKPAESSHHRVTESPKSPPLPIVQQKLHHLSNTLQGTVDFDNITRIAYSTDASAYREMPLAVAFPKTTEDIIKLVHFAVDNKISLIPRTAGTSLAGQVVGSGLVVDVSRYMNKIIEINPTEKWVDVEPGVVLDELNLALRLHGLFFAPETSTSNRCCIGGMLGNNSCGSHSLRYGSTREHTIEADVVLSDGSQCTFSPLSKEELIEKTNQESLEGKIYKHIHSQLSNPTTRQLLQTQAPDPRLTRRNNGYALDLLTCNSTYDNNSTESFNLCKILAGSEGTLAIATRLRLNLEPLPPAHTAVMCMHCNTLQESFHANLVALRHSPVAVELMDDNILHLSEKNIAQCANRFFIEGDPAAILIIELAEHTEDALNTKLAAIEADMQQSQYGYAYPILKGKDIQRVWNLRKAGLGLLSNMVGSAKPVSVIEDTAVVPEHLPAFMEDIAAMLSDLGLSCVHHAHIATGELHLRPVLDLKTDKDKALFREVATRTAHIVRKHRGSISGEHGDGRLRGEFIPIMFGDEVYQMFRELKHTFDPLNIFNEGKIIDTPPMDECLRYIDSPELDKLPTYFDFSSQHNFINAVEQCNGAGDCRKSIKFAGVLCPAFKATGSETDTTRARANLMRTMLHSLGEKAFDHPDVLSVLSACLSCKACKKECPSSVDMTKLKAEFLQHHYDSKGTPLSTRLVASMPMMYSLAQLAPFAYNFIASNSFTSNIIKSFLGFAPERNLPQIAPKSLRSWYNANKPKTINTNLRFYLFIDEFTDHLDVPVGIDFLRLMWHLGYEVLCPKHTESGRTALSKGMLRQAKKCAIKNVSTFSPIITSDMPLVGLEPSTILSFRDEYIDLVPSDIKQQAINLAPNTMLYDEFILREIKQGNITADQFTTATAHIMLHGHCHQKTLASVEPSKKILELPSAYTCEIIPSGCCGMAGSYGYEKAHYATSQSIAEDILLPAVRQATPQTIISAPGTSCREQIHNGTGRTALHPVQILWNALNK